MEPTTPDDLNIPAFLKREDTPESKLARARIVKQRGIRRVARDESRSTISTGFARMDDTGKAILREMIHNDGLKGVQRERAKSALKRKANSVMSTLGPKESSVRHARTTGTTGGIGAMADALAAFKGTVTKLPTGRAGGVKVADVPKVDQPTLPTKVMPPLSKVKAKRPVLDVPPPPKVKAKQSAVTPGAAAIIDKALRTTKTKPVERTPIAAKLAYDWDANEALAKAGKIPALGPWKSYDYHMKDARELCMKGDAKGALEIMDGHRNASPNRDRFYKLLKAFLKATKK